MSEVYHYNSKEKKSKLLFTSFNSIDMLFASKR